MLEKCIRTCVKSSIGAKVTFVQDQRNPGVGKQTACISALGSKTVRRECENSTILMPTKQGEAHAL